MGVIGDALAQAAADLFVFLVVTSLLIVACIMIATLAQMLYVRIFSAFMLWAFPSQWHWFTRTVHTIWSRFWGQFRRKGISVSMEEDFAKMKARLAELEAKQKGGEEPSPENKP